MSHDKFMLGHESNAGSPCLKCGPVKCEGGLDLHFWRNICKTCKCKPEEHDIKRVEKEADKKEADKLVVLGLFFKETPEEAYNTQQSEYAKQLAWSPPGLQQGMMSDIERLTRDTVVELRENIKSMSTNIRLFSTSMRSLYAKEDMYTYSGNVRKLRDDTRNDAMVCLKDTLPLSAKFVASINNYFEYYEFLEFEQWCQMIPQILKMAAGFRQLSETLRQTYENTLTTLKKRQDHARLVVIELKNLKEKFERRKRDLEDTASTKRRWAIGLAFVPGINLIASPALAISASSDSQEAAENGTQAAIQEASARKISGALIPALQYFVEGIKKAAGSFSVMEQELRTFEGNAEKGNTSRKFIHYKVMKTEARDIKSKCQIFTAALPEVRNDLLSMKSSDMWQPVFLKSFLEIIRIINCQEKTKLIIPSCFAGYNKN